MTSGAAIRCRGLHKRFGDTIAVATVLLETGMIAMQEPVTEFNLEAPAGLIGIRAECRDGKVKHRGDEELDVAVRGAVKRTLGDRWVWGRRKSVNDVSALEAATLAAWDAMHSNSGPSVFVSRPRVRKLLVSGSMAEDYVRRHCAEGDDVRVMPDAKPWERDKYRRQNGAQVVVAVASEDEYVPSKYGFEEMVIVEAKRRHYVTGE